MFIDLRNLASLAPPCLTVQQWTSLADYAHALVANVQPLAPASVEPQRKLKRARHILEAWARELGSPPLTNYSHQTSPEISPLSVLKSTQASDTRKLLTVGLPSSAECLDSPMHATSALRLEYTIGRLDIDLKVLRSTIGVLRTKYNHLVALCAKLVPEHFE